MYNKLVFIEVIFINKGYPGNLNKCAAFNEIAISI